MEDIKKLKFEIRDHIAKKIGAYSKSKLAKKTVAIENRLFEFANFLEANIALFYINKNNGVHTLSTIKKSLEYNKIVVLPSFGTEKHEITLMKIDDLDTDLNLDSQGVIESVSSRCKIVPIESIDIAIIPGVAFDEKGGRIGSGDGHYDRLIPKLSITTRKVALAFECQLVQQVPMEAHDKYVDIIITEKRVIYKI